MEEQLELAIRNIESGQRRQPQDFQPQERPNEQWTMDIFWEGRDRPQQQQTYQDQPGPSSKVNEEIYRWKREKSDRIQTTIRRL